MIYFVFDNPNDKTAMSFLNEYEEIKQIYPDFKICCILEAFRYVRYVFSITNQNDCIIFWYDFLGVLFSLLPNTKKRHIFILNILLKNKKAIKNLLAKFLYKQSLNKKNVIFTVTSKEYGKQLMRDLKLIKSPTLLHDPFLEVNVMNEIVNKDYCFCGGSNGRDWNMMINIAKSLPQIKFHFIMSKKDFASYKDITPVNVTLKSSIPRNEFYKEISECSLMVMPLNTEAPAGLLTFFYGAQAGKLIITSNTMTTREYFLPNRGVLCNGLEEFCDKILYYLDKENEKDSISNSFLTFLRNECSEYKYIDGIKQLIGDIK